MDISLDKSTGQYQVRSYEPGTITINDEQYQHPVMVTLETLHQQSLPQNIQDIDKSLLEELKIEQYEAVLLGTGEHMELLEWELIEAAQMMGAPLEIMSTGAACRTFTVLASEGRQVLAILYP
ncbi:Mth938-like domain-containing protein [Kangiella shandongensis]|uniref:Mth938-like domain-containing protein n=1 Tax=Kangiella shandongensis TaxID=2763258 RepID=UPI001CBC7751|nr:Mth938-like domain-containing protein [Kangiella shandongensis]